VFLIPSSSALGGASVRSRSISLKISVSDAPVTLDVTSAVSTHMEAFLRVQMNEPGEYV
jgi:hypothetical protein